MITLKCQTCGAEFQVRAYRAKTAHFCGKACAGVAFAKAFLNNRPHPWMIGNKFRVGLKPAHSFPKGNVPWNKDKKGLHFSPATEFKPGIPSITKQPIGAINIRNDKNGRPRAWVKTADPNIWKPRAQVAWETVHGAIPAGMIVHHKNRDTTDDALGNLELVSRAEHINEHRAEMRKRGPARPKQLPLSGPDKEGAA